MTTLTTLLWLPIGAYKKFITSFDREDRELYRLAVAVIGAWILIMILVNVLI